MATTDNHSRTRNTRKLGSIQDAADELGVHPRTIRRYISAGKLTGYRVGPRMIRVNLDEIAALMTPMAAGGAAA